MTKTTNATGKHWKTLDALKIAEGIVHWALDNGADHAATEAALALIRTSIADAESVSPPDALTKRLLRALEAVLPYAENEGHSLYECWRRDDEAEVKEHADACQRVITEAHAVLARAKAAYPSSVTVANNPPWRFEFEQDLEENPDRVYVMVDGKFEVAIIRTDEGVVVDVYPRDAMETIATTYAFDSDLRGEPA